MRIFNTDGDGNCLFASISVVAYGNPRFHMVIRDKVMDYILVNKEYFKNFIQTQIESIEQYVQRKRMNGVWGDDVELQAISEIYDRAIEIYAYQTQPMRTFHERSENDKEPFRISYHGNSHYNAILVQGW